MGRPRRAAPRRPDRRPLFTLPLYAMIPGRALVHLQKARTNNDAFRSQMRSFAGAPRPSAVEATDSSSRPAPLTLVHPQQQQRWRGRSLAAKPGDSRTTWAAGVADRGARARAQASNHSAVAAPSRTGHKSDRSLPKLSDSSGKQDAGGSGGSTPAHHSDTVFVKDVKFVATGIGVGVTVGVCIYLCCCALLRDAI